MRPGSLHCGYGPMTSVGAVLVRSALCSRFRAPAATASARYTLYEPLCVPITLRCARLVVVPTTGPRSVAVAAPQWMGSAPKPPACEVRRMWPVEDEGWSGGLCAGLAPVAVGKAEGSAVLSADI
ncbi:hypothetical protein D3C72_1398990 [compost metagenome]